MGNNNYNGMTSGNGAKGKNYSGEAAAVPAGGSNYRTAGYPVDIVLCIDSTGSMMNRDLLDQVKAGAISFYQDVLEAMTEKNKKVSQMRVRIIAFRDYLSADQTGYAPMLATPFFTLPESADDFQDAVESIEAVGGSFDDPEDGLEALAYAMNSDWVTGPGKKRHIIVLWTDEVPHPLGHGKAAAHYPQKMAKDIQELGDWWGSKEDPGRMLDQGGKRLILYAPDRGYWSTISENWDKVIHIPSEAGEGMGKAVYSQLLGIVANSI